MTGTATASRTGLGRKAPPGSLVDMVYENESGIVSRRRIRIVNYYHARNGNTYIRGWCFLREEERTFREDRVLSWAVAHHQPARTMPDVMPTSRPGPGAPPAASPAAGQASPQPAASPTATDAGAATAAAAQPNGPAHPFQPVNHSQPRKRSRSGTGFGSTVAAAVFAGILYFSLKPVPSPPAYHYTLPVYRPPAPAVVLKPKPVPEKKEPDRAGPFRTATGVYDPTLEATYAEADLDASGSLSWSELAAFQMGLKAHYRYLSNDVALRPDQFVAQGGGDCDDWALFACGLLRYWGWETYVGSFAPPDQGNGHALCLVRLDETPSRFTYYTVPEGCVLSSGPVAAGYYVPIDYDVVGGITNAMGKNWKLRSVYVPEAIYGDAM